MSGADSDWNDTLRTSLKPSQKKCAVTPWLARGGNVPSWFHSLIRSQSPQPAHRWSDSTVINPEGFSNSAKIQWIASATHWDGYKVEKFSVQNEALYLLTWVCLWETLVVFEILSYQSYPATFTSTMCFFPHSARLSSEKGHSHPANCSRTKGWRKPFPTPCYRVGLRNAELSEIQHNAQRFMRLNILHHLKYDLSVVQAKISAHPL